MRGSSASYVRFPSSLCYAIKRCPKSDGFHVPLGTRCAIPVAYQTVPPPVLPKTSKATAPPNPHTGAPFVYLNYGAMTEQQGRVPPEAFEGEQEAHDAMARRNASAASA